MAPGMKWDHEADAKLFGLFLNLFDVKMSGEMLRKMNKAMGFDPKSQAIAHRIGAARKRAAGFISTDDGTGSPIKPAVPLTPRGPKSATPRSNVRRSAGKYESDDSDDDDSDLPGSPTANTGGVKRSRSARVTAGAKRSYKEPETDEDEDEEDQLEEEHGAPVKKAKVDQGGDGEGRGEDEVLPGAVKEVEKSFFDGDGGLGEAEPEEV
ncbi:hypothetical protein SLS58_005107 [Diplodia intermedia]|uniref:Uncharacterized protein n=1 Tax=Diplodia intermedia TaxID=856260 RepID=A0ABR3TSB8_9PEZI